MDKDLKAQVDKLFADLELNMSTAMGVFCRQAVRLRKIPFELAVDMPNKETLEAIWRKIRLVVNTSIAISLMLCRNGHLLMRI